MRLCLLALEDLTEQHAIFSGEKVEARKTAAVKEIGGGKNFKKATKLTVISPLAVR